MVIKETAVAFEVEGDHVSESDVETGTGPERRGNLAAIPKLTVNERPNDLRVVSLIVVESVVHADATEDVRIEGSVKLVASEDGSDINHEVSGSFDVVELIDSGRSVYGTLSLPAIDIESCSEDRRELVAERNRG